MQIIILENANHNFKNHKMAQIRIFGKHKEGKFEFWLGKGIIRIFRYHGKTFLENQ